jgi:hypothetical protein
MEHRIGRRLLETDQDIPFADTIAFLLDDLQNRYRVSRHGGVLEASLHGPCECRPDLEIAPRCLSHLDRLALGLLDRADARQGFPLSQQPESHREGGDYDYDEHP